MSSEGPSRRCFPECGCFPGGSDLSGMCYYRKFFLYRTLAVTLWLLWYDWNVRNGVNVCTTLLPSEFSEDYSSRFNSSLGTAVGNSSLALQSHNCTCTLVTVQWSSTATCTASIGRLTTRHRLFSYVLLWVACAVANITRKLDTPPTTNSRQSPQHVL